MQEPTLPKDEEQRVATLRELDVLDTPAEERFDRITRMACKLLDVPIALVSLVDPDRQWFKSAQGIDAAETPREISFCGHAIHGEATFVISDATRDPRFADNPLVTEQPEIRFYAGHPLEAPDGSKLGTLCVIDRKPRQLDAMQLETLQDLAGWVASELNVKALSDAQQDLIAERDELRRKAMVDALTRCWNRQAILEVLDRELARAARDGDDISLLVADVDHFKKVNDTYGHGAGDAVLRGVAENMRASVRPYDAVGRYGGEEFLVVLSRCDEALGLGIAERMRRRVEASAHETTSGPVRATLSAGLTVSRGGEPRRDDLIESADRALYRAKQAGRNRVELAAEEPDPGREGVPDAPVPAADRAC